MKIKVKEGKALEYRLDYYQVAVKAEVESLETVRASDPEAAKRIATQRVTDRCTGVGNRVDVAIVSAKVEEI